MSDQLVGKKGSDYPKLEDFTEEQRTAFLGSTLVHAVGKLNPSDTNFTDVNLTMSDLKTDQIQADWNEQDDTKVSYIKNKPEIPSLDGYATESWVGQQGYATEGYVDSKVSGKQDVIDDLEGIRSSAELGATAVQPADLEYYARKTDLPTAESLAGEGLDANSGKLVVEIPVPDPTGKTGKVLSVKEVDDVDTVAWEVAKPLVDDSSIQYNDQDKLEVHTGAGMQIGSGALMTRIRDKGGLAYDNLDAMYVVTDKGIKNNSCGIGIDFTGASENKVLSAHDTGDTDDQNNPIYTVAWNPGIPPVGANQHRGEFLTVNDSDEVVWDTAPSPTISGSDTVNYDADHSGELSVKYDSNTLDADSNNGLTVKNPVPPTTSASNGDVLTYDSTDGIVWAPAQGGGGGGLAYNEVNLVAEIPSGVTTYKQYNFTVPSNNTYNELKGLVAMDDMENWYHLYINVPSNLAPSSEPLNVWIEGVVTHDPSSTTEEFKLALIVNFNGVTMYPEDGKLDLSGTKIDSDSHEPEYYYIASKNGTAGQYFQIHIVGHAFGIGGLPEGAGS